MIKKDLALIYQPLKGKTFGAKYKGEFTMPQTGNPRDVVEVDDGDPLVATLEVVSNAVIHREYGNKVWKGITGPKDPRQYTSYWLWVEQSEEMAEDVNYNFKIDHCKPFACSGETFSYGVSIKVSLV